MTTINLTENKKVFFVIGTYNNNKKKKSIKDFKNYIIKSNKDYKENISENIDNFLYK